MGVWMACWLGVASAGESGGGEITAWGAWSDPRQESSGYPGGPGLTVQVGIWSGESDTLVDRLDDAFEEIAEAIALEEGVDLEEPDDTPLPIQDHAYNVTSLRYSQHAFGDWDGPHLRQIQLVSTQSVPFVRGAWGVAPEVSSLTGGSWVAGDLTGTELQDPNRAHFGWGMEYGARVYIPGPVSVSYRYSLVSVEEPWRFGHQLVHGLIVGASVAMVQAPLYFAFDEDDRRAAQLAIMAVGAVINSSWYWLDYSRHNWPWTDEPPMRMNAHMVGATVRF